MTTPESDPKIIVALDFATEKAALDLVARLDPRLCRLKVGKELFTKSGPALVEALGAKGFAVFLDLKFHDIPNTVASACAVAADLGVWMLNVHASGGIRMMSAARERLEQQSSRPLLIAVTVLTSLSQEELVEIGFTGTPKENVKRLARLANSAGLDGVVCSPRESAVLRSEFDQSFLLVTPGVRPKGAVKDDQSRVTTPLEAINSGSNYLVVGRPITAAVDPLEALLKIRGEIGE